MRRPSKLKGAGGVLENQIGSAKRGEKLMRKVSHLKFIPDSDVDIPFPRQFHEMHAFWDKLDLHFRNIVIPPRPPQSWDRIDGVVNMRTKDMFFHSPQRLVGLWIAECDPMILYYLRDTWWGSDANGVSRDVVLTMYLYMSGRHLNKLLPDHPGHFTEYGSVPLRMGDHELPIHQIQEETARTMARSHTFPVPVCCQYSGNVIYTYQNPELQRDYTPCRVEFRGLEKHKRRKKS